MPSPTPKTVLIFGDGDVYIIRGHINPHDKPHLMYKGGTTPPVAYYHVRADGTTNSVIAVLRQIVKEEHMPEYRLILGDESDARVRALAEQLGISQAEVITRAINTYATIRSQPDLEGIFLRARLDGDKYVVKRLIVP